jgi:hypothetical protein
MVRALFLSFMYASLFMACTTELVQDDRVPASAAAPQTPEVAQALEVQPPTPFEFAPLRREKKEIAVRLPSGDGNIAEEARNLRDGRALDSFIKRISRMNSVEIGEDFRVVANELKFLRTFKGIRFRLQRAAGTNNFNADALVWLTTGIDLKAWSKFKVVDQYLTRGDAQSTPPIKSESEFAGFLGEVIADLQGAATELMSLREGEYPSGFCTFGCDPKKNVANYRALQNISIIGAKLSFIKAFDLNGLFLANQRTAGRLLKGSALRLRDTAILNRSPKLFRLYTGGNKWVERSEKWTNQFVQSLEVDAELNPDPALESTIQKHRQMLANEQQIRTREGRIYHFRLAEFFKNPPRDLKIFMIAKIEATSISHFIPGATTPATALEHLRFLNRRWPGGAPFPLNVFLRDR